MKKLLALFVILLSLPAYSQTITLDLKDAPVRTTLEMMFKQAGVKNYIIESKVSGFVTINLTEQPFENSLKLIMRANTIPLSYIKENDVWIVKTRQITETKPAPVIEVVNTKSEFFEKIHLYHIDPIDLISALGYIINIDQFLRYKGF
jgi:type II secretory pathway component HofQ